MMNEIKIDKAVDEKIWLVSVECMPHSDLAPPSTLWWIVRGARSAKHAISQTLAAGHGTPKAQLMAGKVMRIR